MTIIYFRNETKQIDAIYRDCDTNSPVFRDESVYTRAEIPDEWGATREHKVVLDNGNVIGIEPSENPIQPEVEPPLSTHWAQVNAVDELKTKPLQVRRTWNGKEYVFWCYISNTIKEIWDANKLNIDDFVVVDFIEHEKDKPLATEKIIKTW